MRYSRRHVREVLGTYSAGYTKNAMTMFNNRGMLIMRMLVTGLLASCILTTAALAQSTSGKAASSAPTPTAASTTLPRYEPSHFSKRARIFYEMGWGVDSLTVRSVESGELIRFNFRVLDATKAQALNDKKSEPILIDPRAGVKLIVPSLEKVGQLRQSATPEAGKIYWMAFSNKGGLVKRGDRVNVVIGNFHADGLVVQ